MTSDPYAFVSEPEITDGDIEAVVDAMRSGWISGDGPIVEGFEKSVAARLGRRHGIAVANGSVALDAAFAVLGLKPGDEVIMPTFTIISCAAAVVRAGAIPIVVDCDPLTWTMRAEDIERRINARTRAILLVHIYGLPVDADPILALARDHKLVVIEDAAEAIGQTYQGRSCGGLGELSTLSFYANKHVTCGEGGMVLTDDDSLAERCRSLRNLAHSSRRFKHEELGWNWRLGSLQAALGLSQLKRLEEVRARKRAIGKWYHERLRRVSGIRLPVADTPYSSNDYWVFGVVLDERSPREVEAITSQLHASGIATRPFFWPIHQQPVLLEQGFFSGENYPNAEKIARHGFYLPSGVKLLEGHIDYVCKTLRRLIG